MTAEQEADRRPSIAIFGVKYFPSRGGVSRVVEDLVRNLRGRYEITLYCYRDPRAKKHLAGVRTIELPELPFGAVGVLFYYLACALHLFVAGRHDLVHVHKTDAASFLPLLRLRFPCIATSHEAPYRRDKWSALAKLYFHAVERIFMHSSATLTSISAPLADDYERDYGRTVEFIPNGVDTGAKIDSPAAAALLEAYPVRGQYLLFAARRIMATKGCHTLLEALARADFEGDLVIVGDTDQLPAYTRRLHQLAQGMRVHFVGYVRNKATLLGLVAGASAFVFPSETEGMSIMLLEVANLETPLICSRIPENEAVFDETEVLYFPVGDSAALAEAISEIENRPGPAKARAVRARKRVARDYSSTAIAERYADLYQRELGRP